MKKKIMEILERNINSLGVLFVMKGFPVIDYQLEKSSLDQIINNRFSIYV